MGEVSISIVLNAEISQHCQICIARHSLNHRQKGLGIIKAVLNLLACFCLSKVFVFSWKVIATSAFPFRSDLPGMAAQGTPRSGTTCIPTVEETLTPALRKLRLFTLSMLLLLNAALYLSCLTACEACRGLRLTHPCTWFTPSARKAVPCLSEFGPWVVRLVLPLVKY